MYLEHWGLDVYPYEIVPDLKFIYDSAHYREAMTRLMYAIMRRKGRRCSRAMWAAEKRRSPAP